jgi:hypothetical protein
MRKGWEPVIPSVEKHGWHGIYRGRMVKISRFCDLNGKIPFYIIGKVLEETTKQAFELFILLVQHVYSPLTVRREGCPAGHNFQDVK